MEALAVWVPPGDETAAELLAARGHELDSTPMLMTADISEINLEPRLDIELEAEPSSAPRAFS